MVCRSQLIQHVFHFRRLVTYSVSSDACIIFQSTSYIYISNAIKKSQIHQYFNIQYNLNGMNTDGAFTLDDSNSFFSPYKILSIAQQNKYLGIFFSYFYRGIVCCVYSLGDSNEYTQHTIIV